MSAKKILEKIERLLDQKESSKAELRAKQLGQLGRLYIELCQRTEMGGDWEGIKKTIYTFDYCYGEAEKFLIEALALDSNNAEYLNNLGVVLCDQGQHVKALRLFQQAALMDNDSQAISFNIGVAMINSGKHSRGVALMRDSHTKTASKRFLEAYFDPQGH